MMERASRSGLRDLTKRQEASKGTKSHLCMFMSKESKVEKYSVRCWYSGRMRAAPAYAASTCTQMLGFSCATVAISSKASMAHVDVVPR